VKDPTLVRAGQLACLRLLNCLPLQSEKQTEFMMRMYASLEVRFNNLLTEKD